MKKKTIIASVVVLLILVSAYSLWANNNRPPVARTYTVLEGPYEEVVSALGYVDYEKEVIVSTQVGGIIREVAKKAGERVEIENRLISIDDNDAKNVYDNLQTSLKLAQARLADYQSGYGNNRNSVALQREVLGKERAGIELSMAQLMDQINQTEILVDEGISPRLELDKLLEQQALLDQSMKTVEARQRALADPSYTASELAASIEAAKDSIRRQEEDLEKYNIKAPISGIILETYVKEGELVGPGQNIMKIASDSRKFVVVALDERYLSSISVDQEALLVSDQLRAKGRIHEIAPSINRETGTVDIKVEILDNLEAFLQNMTIRVDLATVTFENALTIPGNYLVENGGLGVYIQNEAKQVEAVDIEVYNKNLPTVYVTNGLKKGMMILEPEGLEEGMAVELKTEGVDGP
ncbi:efflux RND transporter periplasmic adaptor subunit [Petrocella sp. FN5]|uniref:efflux RND transporter periplasmic adaptor subunit n=1 Tax=Petrocella sp. FN5 TaxID=3032002 RepID=UPI0023DCE00D|nr:efflux RND transporter periplasmic adaptor subunit [Petrocella sp. FN5]MDF1617453.1 efflux RND transporter periplasmic adaptor subunit [Petrocella sp. FN5]